MTELTTGTVPGWQPGSPSTADKASSGQPWSPPLRLFRTYLLLALTFNVYLILWVYRAARECPVPLIAVVQGRAFGFGSGLVGACDVALADAGARFALPEMDKGIPPTLVMCALADVNRKALVEMVYSCEAVDASTALAIGQLRSHSDPEQERGQYRRRDVEHVAEQRRQHADEQDLVRERARTGSERERDQDTELRP